jgi:hypothetical protein
MPCMEEGRKRVLLIAASILAARKLAQFEGGKRVPATMSAIADAVRWAEEIMKAIDGLTTVGPLVDRLQFHSRFKAKPEDGIVNHQRGSVGGAGHAQD